MAKPIQWNIPATAPSSHVTPKDVYAVLVAGKQRALCISCAAGLDEEHEFAQCRDGDVVVRVPCQGCGERQERLL